MRKIFTLLVTAVCLCIAFSAKADSVIFAMSNASDPQAKTADNTFGEVNFSYDEAISINGTKSITTTTGSDSGITGIKFTNSTDDKANKLNWFVSPAAGYVFTPTKVKGYINRDGTDVEKGVIITVKKSGGDEIELGKFTAWRQGKDASQKYASDGVYMYEITLSADQQATLAGTDGFYLYATIGVGSGRSGVFGEVTIEGDMSSTGDTRVNAPISWDKESVTLTTHDTFVAPVLNNEQGLSITFESENPTVAEVSDQGIITLTGAKGTAIISANYAGDETTYKKTTVKCTVNVEYCTTTSFVGQKNATYQAGESVDVLYNDNIVAKLTFGFTGGNEFKFSKDASGSYAIPGFVAFTEGNGSDGKPTEGTVYIIEPKYDGIIEAAVVLNGGKAFFVLEDEVALPEYNGMKEDEKVYKIYAFNVIGGKTYKVYCTGSKLGFYGFNYKFEKEDIVEDPLADVKSDLKEALAAAEGIDWDLYTEDAAKALYNAICEAKEVLASDTAGEAEFTNATSALKNAFDDLDNNLAEQNLPTISGPGMYSFFDWTQTNTHDNLKYDAADSKTSGWSDVEKPADAEAGNDPTDISKDNCFWLASDTRDENGYLTVKNALYTPDDSQSESVNIPELHGLKFLDGAFDRSLAIAVNYPTTSLGTYKGGSYLWFGASNGADYLVIPNVEAGSIITMGVESHKTTDQRGIELYVYNNGTKGAKLKNQYGYDVVTPKTYKNSTWLVPDAPAAIDDDDANAVERYDILLHNTAGCHVYYIDAAVEQGPTTAITEVKAEETDAPVVYYNLQGVRVDNPAAGLYIRKQGNNVSKVIIK